MAKLPWCKWYPQDWLSEPGLAMCEPATRGIWADAVNVMLLQRVEFITGNDDQLARLLRCQPAQIQSAVNEIKQHNVAIVAEQNGIKTITNRRLQKELRISRIRSKSGSSASAKSKQTCQHRSASASASASVLSKEGGLGEGRNGVERPSLSEVLTRADFVGLAPWKARDWWQEMEGCGWLDYNHRPVIHWQAMLDRVRTKWEADGRPSCPPPAKNSTRQRPDPTL